MKKKIFAIFVCLLLTLAAGCGQKDPAPETPDTDNPAVETNLPEILTAEEAKQFYADAADIYADMSLANFDVDTEKSIVKDECMYYYRIDDERFESYDDFRKYLNLYFTKDVVEAELMNDMLFTEGKDGYLYVLAAGRGMDIFYAGYSVGEPVMEEDSIKFDVTAYYTTDEPYDGEIFTEAPDDPVDFETETYTFRLVPEDGVWKFDSFHLFY